MIRPLIGITADVVGPRLALRHEYGDLVSEAGGVPVVLAPGDDRATRLLDHLDGIILSGGDDPDMSAWGIETHACAKPLDRRRQAFELDLLGELERCPDLPVLGVCLGMQLMALHAGGALDQHLPDSLETAELHWGRTMHAVRGALGSGEVLSHHRQAIVDAGRLEVVAHAPDGVIEAVRDPACAFRFGVQWHPERSGSGPLGAGLIEALVTKAAFARTKNPRSSERAGV